MDAVLDALRLSRRDARRLGPFALLGLLGAAGLAIGLSASSTLFLVHVGAPKLPYLFLAMPLVMAAYTPLSSLLLRRFGLGRYYGLTLDTLAVGGLTLAAVLSLPGFEGPAVFFAASLYTGLWYIALYTLFWSFVGDYFDLREAKRCFPVLASSVALGSMIGGVLVSTLSALGWVGELFAVWALLALLARLPLRRVLSRQSRLVSEDGDGGDGPSGLPLREIGQAFLRVRYVPVLSALLFLVMLLSSLCQFQYLTIFAEGRDETQLAALLGQLYAGANLFNLVVGLFVFNRLVAVLGVALTALILPVAYAGVFAALSVDPTFGVALFGFFVYEGLLFSVDLNNQNLLFNALPAPIRQEIRLLLEGLSEPLATATAGLALLLIGGAGTDGENLRTLAQAGLAGSFVAVALVLVLRIDYVRAVVTNLKRHWLDFSKPVEAITAGLGAEELRTLAGVLDPADRRATRMAWRVLWPHHRGVAVERLLDLLRDADDAQAEGLVPLLGDVLSAGDADIVRRVLETLEERAGGPPTPVLDELGRHRLLMPERSLRLAEQADDPAGRATAAVGLLNAWTPSANRRGLELVEALYDGDAGERRYALWALGRSRQERYAPVLVPHLADPDDTLRRAALEAMYALASTEGVRLVPSLLGALGASRSPRDRMLLLGTLESIRDPESLGPLLALAGGFTPIEVRRCEQVVCSMGLKSVPQIIQALRDEGLTYAAHSISARALGKLAPAQLEALSPELIEAELDRATAALGRAAELDREIAGAPHPPAALCVLRRIYRDAPRAPLDFILELLSIGGRLPDFELLASSLRSPNPKLRADALETLEQGLERRLFLRLLPLLDGVPPKAAEPGRPVDDLVAEALDGRLDLEVTVAVAVARSSPSRRLRGALARRLRRPLPPAARDLVQRRTPSGDALDLGESAYRECFVEHLAAVALSPFFDRFELEALEPLAHLARSGGAADGDTFAPAPDCFYLVTRGHVTGPADGPRLGPGDVFAAEALYGRRADGRGPFESEDAEWIELSARRLRADAVRRPGLAMALLELRLDALHGPEPTVDSLSSEEAA
ncbi:MAG: MFS transporter [Acidobacteriota bacterium]